MRKLVFKNHATITISSKCQDEAYIAKRCSVTSFEIFRALFDVRPSMRRLSQALQIECKNMECKHTLTVQRIFLREMGLNNGQVSKESAG